MLNLEQLLNVHQTLQAGGATKELYAGIGQTVKAAAHSEFIDNAQRLSEVFSPEQAERYLIKQGLVSEVEQIKRGKHSV